MKSIGVEICESGNREKTLQNAIDLIQHLMKTHKIDKVVRHYDWSKKNCPRILNTDGKWTLWHDFYNKVMEESDEDMVIKTKININGKVKEVDAINKDGNNYVKLQDLRDPKIIVDYDSAAKIPVVSIK